MARLSRTGWLSLAIVLCACGGRPASDTAKETIRLGVLPTADCLPFHYASAHGLLDTLGVQIVTYPSAMDADTAFLRGHIDAVVTDLVKVTHWQTRGDTFHIAMTAPPHLWVISSPTSKIRTSAQLKDKIIGGTRHSAIDYQTDRTLLRARLQPSQINKAQINDLTLRTTMVAKNQLDAAILPEPHATAAIAQGAKRVSPATAGAPLLCVVLSPTIATSDPSAFARALCGAFNQAADSLNAIRPASRTLRLLPDSFRPHLPDTLYSPAPHQHATSPHAGRYTHPASLADSIRQWLEAHAFPEGPRGHNP